MAENAEQSPTTAVEAAVTVPGIDISAPPSTTGTATLVDDIAMTATSLAATPTPGTGTATPFELDEQQRRLSLNVTLADLSARATALYARKDYEGAAEVYSQAAEMQAEMNGETNPENAEILFLYGRALFKVGQNKSDVLGGKAPATSGANEGTRKGKAKKPSSTKKANDAGEGASAEKLVDHALANIAEEASGANSAEESVETKPLFQFTGDENFDDSDEEGAEDDAAEDEEEEEYDDLASAFEILDLARLLFSRRLEAEQEQPESEEAKGKEVAEGDSPAVRHIKERLADTHDLLAEISLENERYPNAITDARASLKYKKELYPQESEVIAEAHYKLSLALEFASVTTSSDEENADSTSKPVDQDLRDEAAKELEAAIASTKLKLQAKEVELATMHSPDDNDITKKQIVDSKEIIADMEQRLVDLRKPPIDVNSAINAADNAMGGLFGAAGGESAAQTEARIEEAKKTANDLTGLVRKKKAKDEPQQAAPAEAANNGKETNGKRKAEESIENEAEIGSKKAKV